MSIATRVRWASVALSLSLLGALALSPSDRADPGEWLPAGHFSTGELAGWRVRDREWAAKDGRAVATGGFAVLLHGRQRHQDFEAAADVAYCHTEAVKDGRAVHPPAPTPCRIPGTRSRRQPRPSRRSVVPAVQGYPRHDDAASLVPDAFQRALNFSRSIGAYLRSVSGGHSLIIPSSRPARKKAVKTAVPSEDRRPTS